jgi:hypothetical protein
MFRAKKAKMTEIVKYHGIEEVKEGCTKPRSLSAASSLYWEAKSRTFSIANGTGFLMRGTTHIRYRYSTRRIVQFSFAYIFIS